MRLLSALVAYWVENRKVKRVIATLEIEASRLRLQKENRELARYVDSLKRYLEDA